MSKKILIIVLLLGLIKPCADASEKPVKSYTKWTYGLEWSYVGTFSSFIHQNFYSMEGSRVDLKWTEYFYMSEAEVYLHFGANLNKNWNLALYAGYTKIAHMHYAIPVSLRATRLFKTNSKNDRWLTYLEVGTGAGLGKNISPILNGRAGCGYRFSLSRRSKLDIIASYRLIYTKPEIYYFGETIAPESIKRNNGLISSFTVGLSITM